VTARAVAVVVGRRLLGAVPLLLAVSLVAYLLLYRAADPVARLRRLPGVREEDVRRLVEQQGLEVPWYEGWWRWLTRFVRGDWGVSTTDRSRNAIEPIMEALPATLELMLLAMLVSVVLALVIGVVSATRQGSPTDHALGALAHVGFAVPTFVSGVLLQLGAVWMRDEGWAVLPFALGTVVALAGLAGVRRGGAASRAALAGGVALAAVSVLLWDRLGGDGATVLFTSQRFSFGREGDVLSVDHLRHLVLPVLTLAIVNVAVWSRFQRAALAEELATDHVAAARARGLSERRVVLGHALRTSLGPLVTLVALDLGAVLSGAVVTETVFSWPGMGLLLRDAAAARDINVAMGIVMLGAVAVVVAALLADLLYAALDPRVDLRGRPR
jgi:peptide/nickel transport system permease protein